MRLIYRFLCFCCVVVATACSHGDATDTAKSLADAESAVSNGDYARATTICDDITAHADKKSMSWRDMCRIATVYAAAYYHDVDAEKSMASAINYMERAMQQSYDSVMQYIDVLDTDNHAAVQNVIGAMDGIKTNAADIPDHEEDGESDEIIHCDSNN